MHQQYSRTGAWAVSVSSCATKAATVIVAAPQMISTGLYAITFSVRRFPAQGCRRIEKKATANNSVGLHIPYRAVLYKAKSPTHQKLTRT
jgi:hypothetical protein